MSMYSVSDYGGMIADKVRMDAYVQALRQTVKPGSVVLDIGTGTGIFALLACQFGARQVHAIEPNDAIHVAQEIAAANGYAERIKFIKNMSTAVTLPEQADVIISDMRGLLPLYEQHIPSIIDARNRLLAPGGTLIPQRDTLWVAVVESPESYNEYVAPWKDNTYGFRLDVDISNRLLTNSWGRVEVKSEQILLEPRHWGVLDYPTVEASNLSGEMNWTVERQGTAHGLIVGFDATLVEGVHFSSAPTAPERVNAYGHAFFPWSAPVNIAAGDSVSVALRANLIGGDYVWSWETRILDQGNPEEIKSNFKQSSFLSEFHSPAKLHKRVDNYVPTLGKDGQTDRLILQLMEGKNTLSDIARQVAAEFPEHFVDGRDAIEHVRSMSETYSQ